LITLYDTACGSENLGDEIIMDAVVHELNAIFPNEMLIRYPTHYPLSKFAKERAWSTPLAFVGGTNLLRNYWRNRAKKNQWALSLLDAWKMNPAILMGVGWNTYADSPKKKAKIFYQNALSQTSMHSCRDSYTVEKLKQCGINNAINTACPTMWTLTKDKLSQAPQHLADEVVFTLTDYRIEEEQDIEFIKILFSMYKSIYFWPQGTKDKEYFISLKKIIPDLISRISILPMNLTAYNTILLTKNIDYIGTRLHAGIRAMQHNRKCMIITVDNRAAEMGKDFILPIIERQNISELPQNFLKMKNQDVETPIESIEKWKSQFTN